MSELSSFQIDDLNKICDEVVFDLERRGIRVMAPESPANLVSNSNGYLIVRYLDSDSMHLISSYICEPYGEAGLVMNVCIDPNRYVSEIEFWRPDGEMIAEIPNFQRFRKQ